MMFGGKFLSDHARVVRLIEIVVGKANAEGLDWPGTRARHHRYDRGRIHAAAEECSQRYVRNQAHACRFKQPPVELFETLFFTLRMVRVVPWQIPILLDPDIAVCKFKQM